MRAITGVALALLAFGCASTAHAASGVAQSKSCAGCNAAAMQAMAKNTMPIGLNFVYDLPSHVMRKYEVYTDSSCRPAGGGDSSGGVGGADKAGDGTHCTSFKVADEMPVDSTVQATFDALYNVWLHNPALANIAKATRVALLPNDASGHPYKPSYVAWDYPQGSYITMMNTIRQQLSTQAGANALVPFMGDDIYGWSVASVNVGPLVGADPGITFGISWDRNTAVQFEWCMPPDMDCLELTITRSANGVVTVTYNGILDFDNNYYPSANGTPPGGLNGFGFPHHGGDHFSEGMRHGGIDVPDMPECGYAMHPFQTVSRNAVTHEIIGVVYSCVQN